jgi:hypothetical protein
VTEYKGLQFTVCVWDSQCTHHEKVSIESEDFLPSLDMKPHWNDIDDLTFNVHHKEGQYIKHLNSDNSTQPAHVFRAIKPGVLRRLASLTICDELNWKTPMLELHPDHHKALVQVNLWKSDNDNPAMDQVL